MKKVSLFLLITFTINFLYAIENDLILQEKFPKKLSEFSFFKEKCIDVALGYDDGFTFTPKFGNFKETEDIFDYLKQYLENKELEKLDIRLDTLKTCIYQINPETLELGELLECEGSDVEYFEWNKQTKSFDEVDSNSLSDEEEEYFH